ncbi:hypothetical protein [Reichenbachiella versicolor]|uniref:hypothetical protein n=1 Tax=Reichenbachiella versicolor TaxID=1821036 RepID=UPI000D6E496C|nr:hypothetical protein [Reichenbachiella versicolor]
MKIKYILALTILSTLLTSFDLVAKQGVKISSTTRDLKSNSSSTTSIYISNTHVAIENSGSKNSTILYNSLKEEFTYIDNTKKEYYLFDKATLVQLKEQVKMFAMMMKQFASQMPEDQRKKLDKIMNPSSTSISYSKSPNLEKVNTWTTSRYEGKNSNEKVISLYIANYQSIGVAESNFNAMKKMLEFAKQNLQEIGSLLPAGGELSAFTVDSNSPIMKEGIPVKTLAYENGASKNENLVNKIDLTDIPDNKFVIPTGYSRKTIDIQNQLGK